MSDLIVNGQATGVLRCLLCDRDAAIQVVNESGASAQFCRSHANLEPLLDTYEQSTHGVSIVVIRVKGQRSGDALLEGPK